MKKIIVLCLLCLSITVLTPGCSSSRKSYSELKGLMLLENVQLGRNKAYYSKHNNKTKRVAYKKYKKNSKTFNVRRN